MYINGGSAATSCRAGMAPCLPRCMELGICEMYLVLYDRDGPSREAMSMSQGSEELK